MVGNMLIGEIEQKTSFRFNKCSADYETYVNTTDDEYDSEDDIFTRWLNKLITPQFKIAKRTGFLWRNYFEQNVVEYISNSSYISPSG